MNRVEPLGTFYGWWRGDPLPELSELPGLSVTVDPAPAAVTRMVATTESQVRSLLLAGHRPYLAELEGSAAALGWCALWKFGIGELGLRRPLPRGDAYLWDFRTLRAWRGRGIYPRLLQHIMRDTSLPSEHFWIGHDLDNAASERGILKAGFRPVGQLGRDGAGALRFLARGPADRAEAGARLLGVPLVGTAG